ncbi:MAG: hypothetical protein P8173_06180 [Gammaproteobacteria bacterium]
MTYKKDVGLDQFEVVTGLAEAVGIARCQGQCLLLLNFAGALVYPPTPGGNTGPFRAERIEHSCVCEKV